MKISLASIKAIFSTGNTPSQQDYSNTFDSFVHIDNQAAVNSQIIDQKISAYDSAQKGTNADGSINSPGDVYLFLAGLADTLKLKTLLATLTNAATWAQLPGKPSTLPLTWTEQLIDTSSVAAPALNQSMSAWLVQGNAAVAGKTYLVIDMKVSRSAFSPTSGVVLYCDQIVTVKLAVSLTTSTVTP